MDENLPMETVARRLTSTMAVDDLSLQFVAGMKGRKSAGSGWGGAGLLLEPETLIVQDQGGEQEISLSRPANPARTGILLGLIAAPLLFLIITIGLGRFLRRRRNTATVVGGQAGHTVSLDS